ncbi:hypothetical protein L1987_52586 [Smallanthus sonchifolius]|uniref:Uncharacterized protein n=1 Tax=Smallanthus sonchifolius TaxID=185202 RepID=A0ACB9EUQ9_9ASTR|nr:hypothetical protein L1987_52586 [Smallanthus sonchifolius]
MIAVCLVGGARRFELTGPSIVENVLKAYPNSDLFLNSPLDANSYKFSLLKSAPKIAGVRISTASHVPETDAAVRVLTPKNSPNGIQGLLQYFNLVEGCLTMIQSYQHQHNFTYNWIVRTRVDGYWSAQLSPELFIPKKYVVPSGSSYGGFNDRFGIGDYTTSVAALSRLSMIRELPSQRSKPNSASVTSHVLPVEWFHFASYPTGDTGLCAEAVMNWLVRGWNWAGGGDGGIQLCDAHGKWEDGWPEIFDEVVGRKLAAERKRVWELSESQCVADFEEMRRRTPVWEVALTMNVCGYGSGSMLT